MKTARDILNDALVDVGLIADDLSSDYLIRRLTAAGYQIIPPRGVHEPTREAAAKVIVHFEREWESPIPWRDQAAKAIRSLGATHG